jgi:hypothetical protein
MASMSKAIAKLAPEQATKKLAELVLGLVPLASLPRAGHIAPERPATAVKR